MKMLFYYQINVECKNCGMLNKLQVKKGTTIEEFVKSNKCVCKNCGVLIKPESYTTEWIK